VRRSVYCTASLLACLELKPNSYDYHTRLPSISKLQHYQENIIRGGQRDRSRRRPDGSRMPKSRAIKGIDEDMKLNKALWEMAEVLRNRAAE
jgi:hypothetical protein